MRKYRILVVDDALVFRRLMTDELSRDPELEVVGTASNGRIALDKLPHLNPDLVILDIEMPEMDGLAALVELRRTHPRLPVIMFSALTELGAEATLNALTLGATDYFTKPANVGGLDASLQVLRDQLIPKIKVLCAIEVEKQARRSEHGVAGLSRSPRLPGSEIGGRSVQVVAIGASTGGPNALAQIFSNLPPGFPVPLLIVQHMPPIFTRRLAERLSAQSSIQVREGASDSILLPGQGWIAPGDHHMTVVGDGASVRLQLHRDQPENFCRPALDVLLRSVAKVYGPSSLTVILTGMGQDGLLGCEAIRAAGGQVLAQDEASSVVWGMPGAVARAGLVNRVMPLSEIADEIVRRVGSKK